MHSQTNDGTPRTFTIHQSNCSISKTETMWKCQPNVKFLLPPWKIHIRTNVDILILLPTRCLLYPNSYTCYLYHLGGFTVICFEICGEPMCLAIRYHSWNVVMPFILQIGCCCCCCCSAGISRVNSFNALQQAIVSHPPSHSIQCKYVVWWLHTHYLNKLTSMPNARTNRAKYERPLSFAMLHCFFKTKLTHFISLW